MTPVRPGTAASRAPAGGRARSPGRGNQGDTAQVVGKYPKGSQPAPPSP
jgi:hypothetical protein